MLHETTRHLEAGVRDKSALGSVDNNVEMFSNKRHLFILFYLMEGLFLRRGSVNSG